MHLKELGCSIAHKICSVNLQVPNHRLESEDCLRVHFVVGVGAGRFVFLEIPALDRRAKSEWGRRVKNRPFLSVGSFGRRIAPLRLRSPKRYFSALLNHLFN
jgi:hypothetical protein